jgi:DNA (cytosine-5)-methyltransferase 1
MKEIKVLNNYCGLGGNRKKWPENVKVTAVEHNPEIAAIYQEYFPEDTVIVGDAHEYLLKHYKEFDFIWSSPPCPTHSRARFWGSKGGTCGVAYPDWKLWQEILFLKHHCEKPYVVENVIPYYQGDVFIEPTIELERHLFWSNFKIRPFDFGEAEQRINVTKPSDTVFGFNIADKKINHRKGQLLRNLVNPELGLYIFEQAQGIIRQEKTAQLKLL